MICDVSSSGVSCAWVDWSETRSIAVGPNWACMGCTKSGLSASDCDSSPFVVWRDSSDVGEARSDSSSMEVGVVEERHKSS